MEVNFCFVYHHKGTKKIKALTLSEAKEKNDELIEAGWSHSATIDPCKWMEYLHNECEPEDIVSEVKDLADKRKGLTEPAY